MALDFIDGHRDDRRPWFLEVAPYAPHSRALPEGAFPGDPAFPPAFRDRPRPRHPGGNCGLLDCQELGVEDLPGFGDDLADNAPAHADGRPAPPAWEPLETTPERAERILRDRARMVQSIDRMVQRILHRVPPNTYVVLTSDNGFHVGQFGLGVGKGAAYESDIRVPLLVVGPGVRPGERSEVVSNIDLAPTFEDLAGIRTPRYRSGLSLVPTLDDPTLERQHYAFVEHTWSGAGDDPDIGDGTLRAGAVVRRRPQPRRPPDPHRPRPEPGRHRARLGVLRVRRRRLRADEHLSPTPTIPASSARCAAS